MHDAGQTQPRQRETAQPVREALNACRVQHLLGPRPEVGVRIADEPVVPDAKTFDVRVGVREMTLEVGAQRIRRVEELVDDMPCGTRVQWLETGLRSGQRLRLFDLGQQQRGVHRAILGPLDVGMK